MGLRVVIIARCGRGCTEMRTFAQGEDTEALTWLRAHERTHDDPRLYVSKHDPSIQARF